MAKRKKEIEIPESVCLFNKQEREYIALTAKSIPYNVDIQTAQIQVPQDHLDFAGENLHVRHLINKFAFVVQATIGAEYMPNKEFKPEMRQRVEVTAEPISSAGIELAVGMKFRDTREESNKQIFADKGKQWEIMYVGDMRPNYKMDKIAFQVSLDHRLFIPVERFL